MVSRAREDVAEMVLTGEQVQRLWSLLLHEGNLFNNRQQLFAVAEAMLLTAYATMRTVASQASVATAVTWMLSVGLASCLMWLYANWHQIERYIKPIRRLLAPHLPEWAAIRRAGEGRLRVTTVMGLLFPALVTMLWLALLVLHLQGGR